MTYAKRHKSFGISCTNEIMPLTFFKCNNIKINFQTIKKKKLRLNIMLFFLYDTTYS